jgi:conjugal transfer pilus assembly protein TrbC
MKRWNCAGVLRPGRNVLVRKFGIAAVPAIVSQEGQRLRIDEVPDAMNICPPTLLRRCACWLASLAGLAAGDGDLHGQVPQSASPTSAGRASCRSPSAARRSRTSADRRTTAATRAVRSAPACVNPTIGLSIGFWEPARHVEVVRKPFCLPSLGGLNLDPGIATRPRRRGFTKPEGRWRRRLLLPGALLHQPGPVLARGRHRLPVPGARQLRPGLPHRGRSAVERRRADADPQPRRGALRQSDRHRRLRGRLRRSSPSASDSTRSSGARAARAASIPWTARSSTTWAACAPLRCWPSASRRRCIANCIAWGWHGSRGLCGPYFEPIMDKSAYKTQPDLPHPVDRQDRRQVLPALRSHHRAVGRRQGVPGSGRGLRLHAVQQEELLCRLLTSSRSPLGVACSLIAFGCRVSRPAAVLAQAQGQAPSGKSPVTEADIARAAKQPAHDHRQATSSGAARKHRMPTDAELARVPVPVGTPRIDALPQPQTQRRKIDLGAIAARLRCHGRSRPRQAAGMAVGPTLLVFVSFSMPEPALDRLVDQAARSGATILLRGLVDGSLQQTVARVPSGSSASARSDSRSTRRRSTASHDHRDAVLRSHQGPVPFRRPAPPAPATRLRTASRSAAGDVSVDYALEYFIQKTAPKFSREAQARFSRR